MKEQQYTTMMFSVPQFIDVEDKVAGPLTWRQLLWMIAMGAILLTIFGIFDTSLSVILSLPIVLFFCAMAFYRPNGFPMVTFLASTVMFLFRPKIAVWERPVSILPTQRKESSETTTSAMPVAEKQLTRERLAELARIIDSRGRNK